MKNFIRLSVLNAIIGNIYGFFFPFSINKSISQFSVTDYIVTGWVAVTVVSGIFSVAYLFFDCFKKSFSNSAFKVAWFIAMIVGLFFFCIGHLLYYIFVFELNFGIKKQRPEISTN